jgi:hypothetical protein
MQNVFKKMLERINGEMKFVSTLHYSPTDYEKGMYDGLSFAKEVIESNYPDREINEISTKLYDLERELHSNPQSKDTYYAQLNAIRKCRLLFLELKLKRILGVSVLRIIYLFYHSLEKEITNASYLKPEWYKIEYLKGINEVIEIVKGYLPDTVPY